MICNQVAPARERGLKSQTSGTTDVSPRRSREGAWIEISSAFNLRKNSQSRSREGAWIEIGQEAPAE